MKLPKRLPYELVIVAGLLLGSCSGDGPRLRSHDEIEDIASDVAYDAIADSERIGALEGRIEELEQRLNM
jgi:hypothetical protein